MHVLRKSFGAYSAGTQVVDGTDKVNDEFVQTFYIDDLVVPTEFVVKRRSMQMMVPTINSRERRKTKRLARAGL